MNQFNYFLPHLLALSCSSPFWEAENTGLLCYRLTVFDALVRTGIPEQFSSYGEYDRHVNILKTAGLVEDASQNLVGPEAQRALPYPGDAYHGRVHRPG